MHLRRQYKILALEADPRDERLIQNVIAKSGLSVEIKFAKTKKEFIDGLINFFPDLVISDYALPDLSGFEALFLAQDQFPEIPFIFVTGDIGQEFAKDAISNGANALVLKSELKRLPGLIKENMRFEKWPNE